MKSFFLTLVLFTSVGSLAQDQIHGCFENQGRTGEVIANKNVIKFRLDRSVNFDKFYNQSNNVAQTSSGGFVAENVPVIVSPRDVYYTRVTVSTHLTIQHLTSHGGGRDLIVAPLSRCP